MRLLTTLLVFCALLSAQATREVGPGKRYKKPCSAMGGAHSGDTILIESGDYEGDTCSVTASHLTIRGVNGRPKIHAPEVLAENKAVWVVKGSDTTFENIEVYGAANSSRNGTPIRQEGKNLTLRNVYFHDNQDGLLTNRDEIGDIVIESSEFAHNGWGEGLSHNMYIGHADSFTLKFCYSHDANVGHLVKSRAAVNYILYNRLIDGPEGMGSYEINLPNGGTSYIIGNLIEKGPLSQNASMISYRDEANNPRQAQYMNSNNDLYVVNNTMITTLVDFVQLANIDWKARVPFVQRTPDPQKKPYPMPARLIMIDPSVKTPPLIQNNLIKVKSLKDIVPPEAHAKLVSNLINEESPSEKAAPPGKSPEGFDLTPKFHLIDGKPVPRPAVTSIGAVEEP